jgi:hypothetical protein
VASKLDGLFDGQVGEFWSLDKSFEFGAVLRGFVRRNNSGLVVLSTLDEGNGLSDSNDANSVRTPRYVAGLTASTGTVLLRPTGTSRSKNYGGHRASTRDFRFRAITSNVLVSRLKSGKLLGLEVRFAEMLRWAQMPIMHTDRQVREDGRLKSVTIRLDSQDREDVVRLHDGLSLRIHPYWS